MSALMEKLNRDGYVTFGSKPNDTLRGAGLPVLDSDRDTGSEEQVNVPRLRRDLKHTRALAGNVEFAPTRTVSREEVQRHLDRIRTVKQLNQAARELLRREDISDGLKEIDDSIQFLVDALRSTRARGGVAGRCAHLFEQLLELIIHDGSPSVGVSTAGTVDDVEPSVGAASGVPASPSGGTPDASSAAVAS